MVKVQTAEQRNNPKRKRRLRKKLHVLEFKETGLNMSVLGLTSNTYDDESIDNFLDTSEGIAKRYGWKGGYALFSDGRSSKFHISMNEISLKNSGGAKYFLVELIEETGYDIVLENIEDAYYPDDNT